MTTRQELGQGIWYDPEGTGYVMLDVTKMIEPQQPIEIEGTKLYPKNEYHCSLVPARKVADSPETEVRIIQAIREFLSQQTIRFIGLTDDRYVCRKDDEMTVIGDATVEGLEVLRERVRGIVPGYESPFAHVTLLKSANSEFGIGVSSDDVLRARCQRI